MRHTEWASPILSHLYRSLVAFDGFYVLSALGKDNSLIVEIHCFRKSSWAPLSGHQDGH